MALVGKFFKDLLFPPSCVCCGFAGTMACEKCLSTCSLPMPVCPFCSSPTGKSNTCIQCEKRRTLDGALSLFDYDEKKVQQIIAAVKFDSRFSVLEDLENECGMRIPDPSIFARIDCIIPVPISKQSFRVRGYNQAALIAQMCHKMFGLPICNALDMKSHKIQHEQSQEERWKDLATRIAAKPLAKKFHHAMVVDDLITTGATLESCSRALKSQGIETVWGLTLAKQKKHF